MSKKKGTLKDDDRIMKFPPLPNSDYVIVHSSLATALGCVNQAMVLQVIQQRLKYNEEDHKEHGRWPEAFRDGRYWMFKTQEAFLKYHFPYWNRSKLTRALKGLKDKGVLLVENHNKMKSDQTRWYSIDYIKLKELISHCLNTNNDCSEEIPLSQYEQCSLSQSEQWLTEDSNKKPCPATSPERSKEGRKETASCPSDYAESFNLSKISSYGIDVDMFLKNFRSNYPESALTHLMKGVNATPTPAVLAEINSQYRFIRSDLGYDPDYTDNTYRRWSVKDKDEKSTNQLDEMVIAKLITGRSRKAGPVDPDMLKQVMIMLIDQAMNPCKDSWIDAFVQSVMTAKTYESCWKTLMKHWNLVNKSQ